MNNLELKQEINEIEPELESGEMEDLVRQIVLAYQNAFNANNPKAEIKFSLTITNHKVARPEGNRDCAYLRLDRSIREKIDGQTEEEGWETKLIHNEAYYFKSMQERVNPEAPWREQLYVNVLARLVSAGLEYAELLQKVKQTQMNQEQIDHRSDEEKRMNKLGLVGANQPPAPLSPADEKYKGWLAKERAKEGL